MSFTQFEAQRQYVDIPTGRIAYVENGSGQVALFLHGRLLNGHFWRHQLTELGDIRRCIAVDLLAHGATGSTADQDVSYDGQVAMLKQYLDVRRIDMVDLVGNDSGTAIAQIFAAKHRTSVRSLTLTDGDTFSNWPPLGLKTFFTSVAQGGLRGRLHTVTSRREIFDPIWPLASAMNAPPILKMKRSTLIFDRFYCSKRSAPSNKSALLRSLARLWFALSICSAMSTYRR